LKIKNKHWEELVSLTDTANGKLNQAPKELDTAALNDYKWLINTRRQLARVFYWDEFNKQTAKINLDNRLQNNQMKSNPRFLQTVWFRAAVILIAIISGAFLNFLINGTSVSNQYTEITVPPGQMTQIRLPDGSKVLLNSGSVFKYSSEFNHSKREVYIDGQAFLEVAKNKNKPFEVNTNKFSVQVLGTIFNISAYSDENTADVTLVEGSVQIRSENNHKLDRIVPGQSASLIDGNLKEINDINTEFFTSWKDGKIIFRKEPLEEIAKKLERWYNVEIRFEDDELKKLVYSGTLLKYKPIEQVFKSFILLNKDVDFVSENRIDQKNIIFIKKRDSKK
jgi:transmembrane sensor